MIPEFPEFKKLELEDKDEIEGHTRKYPPYSDFEFASLYAWDVQEKTMISRLNGNLVVRFTDYITGDFFYTFIGNTEVNDTTQQLLDLSVREGLEPKLKLIPEISIKNIDISKFTVTEDRDNFDYIYETKRYITYGGSKLKSKRNDLSVFLRRYVDYKSVLLDLTDSAIRSDAMRLQDKWAQDSPNFSANEEQAFGRFMQIAHRFKYLAAGISIDNTLIGLGISTLIQGDCANCLFLKGNKEYQGINAALLHENAKLLLNEGYSYINYEQDLGIVGLRRAKEILDPVYFLKKHAITPKSGS